MLRSSLYAKKIFFYDFSWEGGGTLPKIVINLPRTYAKLPCKGEPDWFSD